MAPSPITKPPLAFLFVSVDASFLAAFRIGFGLILLFEAVNYGVFLCLECMYHSSDMLFKYHHFEWVTAAPLAVLRLIWLTMAVAAIGVLLGYRYRLSMLIYTVGFTYQFLLDQALYLNHFYMVILFCILMLFMPANRYWAIDAQRKHFLASNVVPYWSKFLLAAQLEIVLLYAGFVKLNSDWLQLEPLRMWLTAKSQQHGLLLQWLTQDWSIALAAYGVVVLHLIGAPLLLWRRTRLVVLCFYAVFHVINMFVFNIGIFPWLTLYASLLFFDADWPKQFWRWLIQRSSRLAQKIPAAPASERLQTAANSSSLQKGMVVLLICVWLLVQLVVPLRHFVLPGDVAWNESGHRFSWRMKLRSKRGVATFTLVHADGSRQVVQVEKHLNRKQIVKMACIPDLVWQFAQFVEQHYSAEGDDAEVYVDAQCSLNGRRRAALIRPDVDLTSIKRDEAVERWILPLPASHVLQ